MRLCLGSFAKILTLCAEVSDRELVERITRTIDENSEFKEKENRIYTAVSRVLNCSVELSRDFRALARKAEKTSVISKFGSIVIPIFDDGLKAQMVLALLDIINKDTVIDVENRKIFEHYIGIQKSNLDNQKEFVLDEFLSGILLYTLNATRNMDGAACGKSINCIEKKNSDKICDNKHKCVRGIGEKHLENFNARKDTITVWDSIAQKNAATQGEFPTLQIHKIFISAIGDYQFWDYIGSEPLDMYLVNTETEADVLEELCLKYDSYMADTIQSQFGANSGFDYSKNGTYISDDSQDEKLPEYSNKRLEANVLSNSECFVKFINHNIIAQFIDNEAEGIYKDINIFKKKLDEYNKYLWKHLKPDGNYLILKDEKTGRPNDDSECREPRWDMMGFHSTTRRFRSKLLFLYKRICYGSFN